MHQALSDFWRQNRSSDLENELLNILAAASGYTKIFDLDCSVAWADEDLFVSSKKEILLDFAPLMNKKPPFDGKDIDLVMGIAIHECGHFKWSYSPETLDNYFQNRINIIKTNDSRKDIVDKLLQLKSIAHVLEDGYINSVISINFPALGAYIKEAMQYLAEKIVHYAFLTTPDLDNPSWDSVMRLWWSTFVANKTITLEESSILFIYLNKLNVFTKKMLISASLNNRLDVTFQIWQILNDFDYFKPMRSLNQVPFIFDEQKGLLPKELKNKFLNNPRKRLKPLLKKYLLEGEKRNKKVPGKGILMRSTKDTNEAIRKLLGAGSGERLTVTLAEQDNKLAQKLRSQTMETATLVRRIFEAEKRVRTRHRRALSEGSIDKRRLYKAGAEDYKIFEKKDVVKPTRLAVSLLIDSSESMGFPDIVTQNTKSQISSLRKNKGEGQIMDALRSAMALKVALGKIENINLMAIAYHGTYYGTELRRVFDRKNHFFRAGIKTGGGTPSGVALLATALEMVKSVKAEEKLIIHITDGAPNTYACVAKDSYDDVTKAVELCRSNHIDVLTLTLSRFDDEVIDAYNGFVEFINDFTELPKAISLMLFKRRVKNYK